jgi:hypothetical protein
LISSLSLRHVVATLAYRATKTLRDAPDGFSGFRPGPGSRSAGEILAHMCDLADWLLSQASGDEKWRNSPVGGWDEDSARFCAALEAFDQYLGSGAPLHATPEKLFQGGLADALTHTGQLAMMRRLAGARVRGENYSRAKIAEGSTGLSQAAPVAEFGE